MIRHNFSELVKELTLAVQNNEHEEVKTVEVIGKAAAQLRIKLSSFLLTLHQPAYHHPQSVHGRQIKGHK